MLMPPLYSRPAEEPGLIRLWPLPACSDEKSRNVTQIFEGANSRNVEEKINLPRDGNNESVQ